ncbi:MAG: FHA domain-containing protein, partial [Methylobacterium sp.]|nr:FHA domain-containing protein [Methylobacterium sp.]
MSKLIYSLEGAFLGEFPLDKERTTIGRRPTNDIHIDNLAISGQHAAVITIGNDAFLEDLESTNGTLVNGKPVKKHVLQHGDLIEIGKYQLKFINEAAINAASGATAQQDFDKTMIIRPSAMKAVPPPAAAPAGVGTTTITAWNSGDANFQWYNTGQQLIVNQVLSSVDGTTVTLDFQASDTTAPLS